MADKMNINEYLMNKRLLEQITAKKSASPGSQAPQEEPVQEQ